MGDKATSKKYMRSLQYGIARAVLQIKASPAYIATIGDLGWLPLSLEADELRLNYFHYLKHTVKNGRLCKQVLCEMLSRFQQGRQATWPFCKELKEILNKVGMDWAMDCETGGWLPVYKKLRFHYWNTEFFREIDLKSSLAMYERFKLSVSAENYIFNIRDFRGVQLKFKARTATLGLNADRERWGLSDGKCDFCHSAKEDIFHFFFICPLYNDMRQMLFSQIEQQMQNCNLLDIWQTFIASSLHTKLCFLLGDMAQYHSFQAYSIFDSAGRQFLKDAMSLRAQDD